MGNSNLLIVFAHFEGKLLLVNNNKWVQNAYNLLTWMHWGIYRSGLSAATFLPITDYNSEKHLQFMRAVGRFVHAMSLLQQLEQFFYWDTGVRRASQSEDLPQQHPIGPPEHTHKHTHTHDEYRFRGQTALMPWSSQEVCSPDKQMNLVWGKILILNNVYCTQFKIEIYIPIVSGTQYTIFVETRPSKQTRSQNHCEELE